MIGSGVTLREAIEPSNVSVDIASLIALFLAYGLYSPSPSRLFAHTEKGPPYRDSPALERRISSENFRAAAFGSSAWLMALIMLTPSAPASMTGAALSAVMPPIPTIGMVMP